jgi:putative salt-induced outer membrane protein YdiY
MRRCTHAVRIIAVLTAFGAAPAFAQAPPAPPKIWTATAGGGLALTDGNTDTSTVNASYEMTYDPQTRNVVKSDGLFLRGKTEGTLSADRLGLNGRDEFTFNDRAYVFGQNQFLRDRFKDITYLLAPTAGLGYALAASDATKLGVDAGIGGVWEKNPGFDVSGSGAVTLGEKLAQVLTATTSVSQSYSGLWKTADFGDSLHIFNVGVAIAMTSRVQFKLDVLDTFKSQPPLATVQKNDVATLISLVYKM